MQEATLPQGAKNPRNSGFLDRRNRRRQTMPDLRAAFVAEKVISEIIDQHGIERGIPFIKVNKVTRNGSDQPKSRSNKCIHFKRRPGFIIKDALKLPNPGSPRTRSKSAPQIETKSDQKNRYIHSELFETEKTFLRITNSLCEKIMPRKSTICDYLFRKEVISKEEHRILHTMEIILKEIAECSKALIHSLHPNDPQRSLLSIVKKSLSIKHFRLYSSAIHNYILLYQQHKTLIGEINEREKVTSILKKFRERTGDKNSLEACYITAVQRLPRIMLLLTKLLEHPKMNKSKSLQATRREIEKELERIGSSHDKPKRSASRLKLKMGEEAFQSILYDRAALEELHSFERSTSGKHIILYFISTQAMKTRRSEEDKAALTMYASPEGHVLLFPDLKGQVTKESCYEHACSKLKKILLSYQEKNGTFKIKARNLEEVMNTPRLDRKFSLYMVWTGQERILRAYYELEDIKTLGKNFRRQCDKLNMFVHMYLMENSPEKLSCFDGKLSIHRKNGEMHVASLLRGLDSFPIMWTEKLQEELRNYLKNVIANKILSL